MSIVIEIEPLNPATAQRVTLRLAAGDHVDLTGLDNAIWWPGVSDLPTLTMEGWDGDFTGAAQIATASFSIDPVALRKNDPLSPAFRWAGAPVRIHEGEGPAFTAWTEIFTGLVEDYETDEDGRYRFSAKVDTEPFEADLLSAIYLGNGGAEGSQNLKAKVKPICMGFARNVEPVLIDAVNWVYQVHGYGSVQDIPAVYERAADFRENGGTLVGDFASFSALVAATIPEGSYGTCLEKGMFRLGAPPAGLITADVKGDNTGGWHRTTSAVIRRLCAIASVSSSRINDASLTALESAVPYPINLYLTNSITLLDLVQQMAQPCNAQAIINWNGQISVCRFGSITTPAFTLDHQGAQMPPVLAVQEIKSSPPFWRIEMQGNRCWRPQGKDEVAYDFEQDIDAEALKESILAEVQAVLDGKRTIFVRETAPSLAESEENDWWNQINEQGKLINTYRRVGDIWVLVDDARIGAALQAATGASDLADSKAVVFTMYSASDELPTGTDEGDILVRAYLNPPQIDYWNGSAWQAAATYGATAAQAQAIVDAFNAAGEAQSIADGKVDTFYQPTPPTGAYGDLWFDTDDGNKLYRHNGSNWVAVQDTRIGDAITAAGGAQATADGKITTYFSEGAPAATALGDLWFQPSSGRLLRWNGAGWGSVSTIGAPYGTIVGNTPAGTVEGGAAAGGNAANPDGIIKDNKVPTPAIQANAVTQSIFATLPTDRTLGYLADNVLLELNVDNVQVGEVLRAEGTICIGSTDDLLGFIKIVHTPPGGPATNIFLNDIKFDSDGGASTRIPLSVRARAIAGVAGTHNLKLIFRPTETSTHTARIGTEFEVERRKR